MNVEAEIGSDWIANAKQPSIEKAKSMYDNTYTISFETLVEKLAEKEIRRKLVKKLQKKYRMTKYLAELEVSKATIEIDYDLSSSVYHPGRDSAEIIDADVKKVDDFFKRRKSINSINAVMNTYPLTEYLRFELIKPTDGGIECWQTIKIRTILASLFSRHGYPLREYAGMGYFSGISCWIPVQRYINHHETRMLWENAEKRGWDGKSPHPKWRTLILMEVPEPESSLDILTGRGVVFDFGMIDLGFELYQTFTNEPYPIFENLSFYNTIHDILIYHNWDKIRKLFNMNGY